jgi:mono/diheme cytochrome c family protein
VPGVVCAQNITADPNDGLGKWSDGEIMRAIREGVDRNGDALFPMMPYPYYHDMSDEDVRAVVVYLRSLPPVRHPVPQKRIDFPVNILVKLAPQPLSDPVVTPDDKTDHLGYGKYLVTLAGCRDCHTPRDAHGQPVPGRDFAGGWVMTFGAPGQKPWHVVPPNITPHPEAYFGTATRDEWIGLVKSFAWMGEEGTPLCERGRNTLMPWVPLSGLTETDLGAIYDFMKTVPPIANKVEPFPDARASL